jgi:hypothetical protein
MQQFEQQLRLIDDCFDHDTDYYGNEFKMLKTPTAQDCQSSCAKHKECVEFTWLGVPKHDNRDFLNRCYLKNARHTETAVNVGFISGPKECGKLLN